MSQFPVSRSGPFWEFLDGRRPAPPAAATLGWELSWVAPERGEIEVFFDARDGFTNPMGRVQGGFLTGELRNEAGEVLATATATARIVRPRVWPDDQRAS